ncbi:hypothetical protein JOS77_09335 [Chromobacterium haemolyticum]|nr:hypothetical protein JOS77_09335 [Chromobacterium haemolyticum]
MASARPQSLLATALSGGGMTAQAPAVEQKRGTCDDADAWQAVQAGLARDCAKYCDLAAQGAADKTISAETRGQLQELLPSLTELKQRLQSERLSPLAMAANLKAGNGEN